MMVDVTDLPDTTETQWMTAWSREEGARRARERLLSTFGVVAKGTWSAPGRVNLVGEYTDISKGVCLSTVIPHRTYVAVASRDDSTVRITTDLFGDADDALSVWEGDLENLEDLRDKDAWMSYPAGVLWSLQEHGYAGTGMDIAISSCVPISAGLSSSTSLTAATALAVNAVWGLALPTDVGATELAEVCMDAENDLVGGATAGAAQHTILRCAPGEAIHLDFGSRPPLAQLCPLTLAEYGLGLLIIDTRVRSTRQVAMVRERMADAAAAAQALGVTELRALHGQPNGLARIKGMADPVLRKRARHIFTENERVDQVRDELHGHRPRARAFRLGGQGNVPISRIVSR